MSSTEELMAVLKAERELRLQLEKTLQSFIASMLSATSQPHPAVTPPSSAPQWQQIMQHLLSEKDQQLAEATSKVRELQTTLQELLVRQSGFTAQMTQVLNEMHIVKAEAKMLAQADTAEQKKSASQILEPANHSNSISNNNDNSNSNHHHHSYGPLAEHQRCALPHCTELRAALLSVANERDQLQDQVDHLKMTLRYQSHHSKQEQRHLLKEVKSLRKLVASAHTVLHSEQHSNGRWSQDVQQLLAHVATKTQKLIDLRHHERLLYERCRVRLLSTDTALREAEDRLALTQQQLDDKQADLEYALRKVSHLEQRVVL